MGRLNTAIEWNTRLCTVNDETGYFHTWEHFSKPLPASPFIGGEPAGVFSQVFGIVEFKDGVRCVDPTTIKFCDEKLSEEKPYAKTNADSIRAMSDEELAEFLGKVHAYPCETCCNNLNWCRRNNAPETVCEMHYLSWLKEAHNPQPQTGGKGECRD